MTNWTDIGALEDIPERGARVVKTHIGCVAVFRTIDNEVFAIDDACPHKGGPCQRVSCTAGPSPVRCTTWCCGWTPDWRKAQTPAR